MRGLIARLVSRLSLMRMKLLGYRYDYDRSVDEKIIAAIYTHMASALDGANEQKRRLSRTIAQYRAQLAMRPRLSIWAFEGASFFALPFYLFGYWITYVLRGGDRPTQTCGGVQLVFANRWRDNPEIFAVPGELADRTIVTKPLTHHSLKFSDVRLLAALLAQTIAQRTPFPFQLVLKCAVDIASVRAAVMQLKADFVLVYWEFSCSLSAITLALAHDGIETYNVMHGDKHYYAKHAFFEVDRCYCWNTFYVDIFKQEHVHAEFRVFTNPGFKLSESEKAYRAGNTAKGIGIAAPHIATLANRNDDQIEAAQEFSEAVNALAINHDVTIRPHPFYATEFNAIGKRLLAHVTIELPTSKPARMFLLDHTIIIGTVSTLLLEAAHVGTQVVILSTPVMTDVERYHYLYEMENVSTCTLDQLTDTIAAIDDEAPVGQTVGDNDSSTRESSTVANG